MMFLWLFPQVTEKIRQILRALPLCHRASKNPIRHLIYLSRQALTRKEANVVALTSTGRLGGK